MKIRTSIQAGAECSALATFWKKQAIEMEKVAKNCVVKPIYNPYTPYPIGPAQPAIPAVVGYYDGRDYSGYCG